MPNDEWTSLSRKKKHTGMTPEQIEKAQEILRQQAELVKWTPTKIAPPGKSPFGMDKSPSLFTKPKKRYPKKLDTQKFFDKYKDNKKLWINQKDQFTTLTKITMTLSDKLDLGYRNAPSYYTLENDGATYTCSDCKEKFEGSQMVKTFCPNGKSCTCCKECCDPDWLINAKYLGVI